jgi:tetratricopeptide (TPR) repeat protein
VLEVHDEEWRFAHDKLREKVIAQIAPAEKRHLYGRLAQAVENVYPQDNSRAEILLGYWRAAEEPAKALPYLLYVARGRVELASHYQETRQLLLEGLAWSRTLPASSKEQSALVKRLGDLHFREGDYAAAREHYTAAFALAEQAADALLHASALHGLSMVDWREGNLATAQQRMQTSLALAHHAGDQEQIISTLIMIAILYSEQADYTTAGDYFQQSLTLAEAVGDVMSVILCRINLGNNAQMRQNYTAALAHLSTALTEAQALQARRYIAHAASILALVAQQQGDLTGALTSIRQAVAIDREIDDRFGLTYDLVTCGEIQLALGAVTEAHRALHEGLQVAKTLGGTPTILHALLGFARLALHRGQAEQAAELYGFISAHPALTPEMQQRDLAKLLAEVAAVLPSDTLAAAQTHGRALELEGVLTRLLAQTG